MRFFIENYLQHLSISNEEDEGLEVENLVGGGVAPYDLCMVGMFLTYNVINFQSMRNTLADVWHLLGGIEITNLGGKHFLFPFFHQVDLDRALNGAQRFFN